jgi:pSer/pThr/pTyr-binding forkhead associated (FHA) protein
MKLSLVVLTPGKTEGKILNIPLAQFVIGRDPQCHLRPASPSISKRHCALIQRDGKAFIHDFDSTNGTFVNDQPVKGEVELHEGDVLKVGPLLFSVKIEASPAVNRPTPVPPTKAPAQTPAPAAAKPAPAPAPAKKPAPRPAEEDSSDEDSVAAMLLSLQDDSGGSSGVPGEVPEGSTIMDLSVPLPGEEGQSGEKKEGEKPKDAPKPNTSNAAKALLEKYMRRPR